MIIKEFEQQVERLGWKPAIKTGKVTLTYNELNEKADRIARRLIETDNRAEGNNDRQRIALLLNHGVEIITALLAVLKAGKTYIPLDVTHPEKRLTYILENAESYLIITDDRNLDLARRVAPPEGVAPAPHDAAKQHSSQKKSFHENNVLADGRIEILNIDRIDHEDPGNRTGSINREVPDETPAYILYTSGSTGAPKGVVQSRRNILHHARAWIRRFSITEEDRLTLLASLSHDGSVPDIYGSLLSGATLYPYDVKQEGPRQLMHRLVQEKITLWHSVPTLYRYFTQQLNGDEGFADLRLIILGGEAVRKDDLVSFKRYFPHANFANIYGQTESTVNSIWTVSHDHEFDQIEIGEPVADTQMILVNDEGDIVGDMGTGEIVIAGSHSALGYWRDEEHTRKAFTHDDELGRLYWTGDLGRLTAEGNIVIIGRKDSQVKIRGFRVELAEIETALLRHEAVREAAAAVKAGPDGENCICAYMVPYPGNRDIAGELRGYLAKELPDYMMPGHFIMMDKIPLTPTGKIDRNNLPEPVEGNPAAPVYEAPRSKMERELVSIWEEILGQEKIGINYNFIDLGGHSLLVLSIISEIQQAFEVELQFQEVFAHPTIKELAAIIASKEKKLLPSIEPAAPKARYAASPEQVRLFTLSRHEGIGATYNMPIIRIIGGKLEAGKVEETFRCLIARHEVLRTSFAVVDDKVVQYIHPEQDVDFKIEYLGQVAPAAHDIAKRYSSQRKSSHENKISTNNSAANGTPVLQYGELEPLIDDFLQPFDLTKPPLIRVKLVKLSPDRHLFILDKHHIISDGISETILIREFEQLYHGKELPGLRLQYKDYAEWFNRIIASGGLKEQEDAWLDMLKGELPVLNLPLDYLRPPVRRYEGEVIHFWLEKEIVQGLDRLTNRTGTTRYMVLSAVLNILLHKYTRQEDIIMGAILSGRTHPELEDMMGLFVKTLVLRNFPSPGKTFAGFLAEVKGNTLKAFENQMYPFDRLMEKLEPAREPGRNPLFDAAFILQNYDKSVENNSADDEGLKMQPFRYDKKFSWFDLIFEAVETKDRIKYSFKYSTALFRKPTIELMKNRFLVLIENIINNPESKIRELEYMIPLEKEMSMATAMEFDF